MSLIVAATYGNILGLRCATETISHLVGLGCNGWVVLGLRKTENWLKPRWGPSNHLWKKLFWACTVTHKLVQAVDFWQYLFRP